MQQHIPAWKRIGLKLKFAKDSSHPPYQSAESEINGTSTGNHEQDETPKFENARPPKKRKLSRDSSARQHPEFARTLENELSKSDDVVNIGVATRNFESGNVERPGWEKRSEEQDSSAEPNRKPSQQSRRKSVTFTPDTKQEDGFSSSFFKQPSSSHQSDESEAVTPQSDPSPIRTVEKSKPPKTKKSKEERSTVSSVTNRTIDPRAPSSQSAPASTQSEATQSTSQTGQKKDSTDTNGSSEKRSRDKSSESKAIAGSLYYLQQFSRDKSSWRFNKKKQTILLKNLFDIHLIPSQHNQAIIEYISGLQGQTARQRVIEDATQILQSIAERQGDLDMQSMESEEARRRAYAKALEKDIARCERLKADPGEHDERQLAGMKHDVERGRRADAVLFEALNRDLHPEQYQQSIPPAQPARPAQLNGTNKRESSTSTSSSRPVESKRKKRKTRTATFDDSSSSSSSDTDNNSNINVGSKRNPTKGPTSVREALTVTSDPATAFSSKSTTPSATGKGTRVIFDDDLLDQKFPHSKSYHEVAPKRKQGEKDKGRGFYYAHGTKDDESGSESD